MKLFAVEITYKAYVWAEDRIEAEDFQSEIVKTECCPDVEAYKTDTNVLGWDGSSCVYHKGSGDLMLKDVLATLAKATTQVENTKGGESDG